MRIRLAYTAVNRVDLEVRAGQFGAPVMLPHILGTEGVGVVDAIGAAVAGVAPGERVATQVILSCGRCAARVRGADNLCRTYRVLGCTTPGCYAQYVCVPAHRVVRLPDALPFATAIAGQKLVTAWEALVDTAHLAAGETVLVNGATGGVGTSAVQLAAHLGARVIASGGSDDKLARARELGAWATINYRNEAIDDAVARLTGGEGVPCAFDPVGGTVLEQTLRALAPGGRVAVVGAHTGERIALDAIDLFRRHIAILGAGRPTKAIAERVYALLAAGAIAPVVDRAFPLAQVALAHRLMESRAFFGRLLIEIAA